MQLQALRLGLHGWQGVQCVGGGGVGIEQPLCAARAAWALRAACPTEVQLGLCRGGTEGVVGGVVAYLGFLWYVAFGGGADVELRRGVEAELGGQGELAEGFLHGRAEDGEERVVVDEAHLGLVGVYVDVDARRVDLQADEVGWHGAVGQYAVVGALDGRGQGGVLDVAAVDEEVLFTA